MGRRPSFDGVQGWFGQDSGINIDLRRGSPAPPVRVDTRQVLGNAIGVRPSDIHRYAERPIERVDQAWRRGSGPFHPDGAGGFRELGDRISGVFRGIFGGGRDRDDRYYDDRRGPPERGTNFQFDEDPRTLARGRGRERDYPRESGPEFQRQSPAAARGRGGVDVGTDDFSPLQTNPETLRALDDFQTKINSGTIGQLSDRDLYTRVSQAWAKEKPAAMQMFENGGFAKSRAGLNEFINFTREAEQNPGLLSLHQQLHENPALAREVADQWRKDVGADASSPTYKGGKPTILDKLSEATNDETKFDAMTRAKTFVELQKAAGVQVATVAPAAAAPASTIKTIDPNTAIGTSVAAATTTAQAAAPVVPTSTGTVTLNRDNPAASTFTPAAPAATSLYASNTPVDTKMLNELSAKGITAEMRMREIDGSTHLFADKNGKIVGGYTSNAQGQTQNFLTLDDVTKKLADAGKTVQGMEGDIQVARNSGMKPASMQMADTAPKMELPKLDASVGMKA